MMSDYLLAVRAEVFKNGLYRKPHEPEFLVDKLPARQGDLSWYCAVLLRCGDMLIMVGTRLKNTVQPAAVFSQEML